MSCPNGLGGFRGIIDLGGGVQTANGLPIHHEVFGGYTAETATLVPTMPRVLARFPIPRLIVVADRGFLSLDSLAELPQLRMCEDPLEFILAGRVCAKAEFQFLLEDFRAQAIW